MVKLHIAPCNGEAQHTDSPPIKRTAVQWPSSWNPAASARQWDEIPRVHIKKQRGGQQKPSAALQFPQPQHTLSHSVSI